MSTQKVTPCLWFNAQALEAVQFYTSVIPGSQIVSVHYAPADSPGQTAGGVILVDFTLAGLRYQALNGGPYAQFSDAISLSISCEDQDEVDRLSDLLTRDGGKLVQCGWLKDRYGLAWQIVPKRLVQLMSDPDRAKAKRVMEAMMQMVKIDVAALERAAAGN